MEATQLAALSNYYEAHSGTYNNIKNFTADYYLKKNGDTTRLDVVETFDMTFPEGNEKHGPVREIPFTNKNGKNLTVERKGVVDLEVLMDGQTFPVAKTERNDDSVTFYIGRSSQYLHGEHTFTLKYHFVNVITEGYINNGTTKQQELYWDANGTGWTYTFAKVKANLHIADPEALSAVISSQTSCYVGSYGSNGSDRCLITKTDDGYSFEAEKLDRYEGLTFAVDFEDSTYAIPPVKNDYTVLIGGSIVGAIFIAIIIAFIRSWKKKSAGKSNLYKGIFVKPEYEPTRGLTVAEGERLMMSGAKKSYVATLLELAVSGRVKIVKGEPTKFRKKDTWKVEVISVDGISKSQRDMLELLNGGDSVHDGDVIDVKRRTATSHTAALARSYASHAFSDLKTKNLQQGSNTQNTSSGVILASAICFFTFGVIGAVAMWAFIGTYAEESFGNVIGADLVRNILLLLFVVTWIVGTIVCAINAKYGRYTDEGLRAARELEGLKLYIEMAEADRLKFLQSVKGADTSSEGIVKLYEKLLPWAALFGCEESWMQELNKYYKNLDYDPTWCGSPDLLDVMIFSSVMRSVNTSAVSTASYSSGGSGSSSSGGFGGGGGGFSGGGGGGGGGGSW